MLVLVEYDTFLYLLPGKRGPATTINLYRNCTYGTYYSNLHRNRTSGTSCNRCATLFSAAMRPVRSACLTVSRCSRAACSSVSLRCRSVTCRHSTPQAMQQAVAAPAATAASPPRIGRDRAATTVHKYYKDMIRKYLSARQQLYPRMCLNATSEY